MYGYVILELRVLPGEAKISDAVFHSRQSGWDALFCRIVIKTVGYCGGFDGKRGIFMRKRDGFVKQAAIFAAAALVVPAAAQAKEDPGEELEEILETQMEQGEKSLLSKTLGLDELQENMEEDGFSVQTKFGVSRETWELLGVEAPTSEDGYLQMNLRAAEDAERWQFDLEAATDENTKFLTLSLYADEDQLAVSIPQFYDGALAIRSGSLLQQYSGSWLEQMLDQPLEEDVDLSFVPGGQEEDETQEDDSWELVKDAARVEKREQGDETVYSVIVPTETFLEFCQAQYDGMVEWLASMATVTTYGDEEAFFAYLKEAMEEECVLDFHVKDTLLTNITLETTINTAAIEEYQREQENSENPDGPTVSFGAVLPGTQTETGGTNEENAEADQNEVTKQIIGGADGSTDIYIGSNGVITEKLSFAFTDPENPNAGFESSLKLENGEKKITVELSGERKRTGNTETYTLHLLQSDADGVNFDEDFYNVSFNAETGEYDGVLNFGEEVGMIGLDAAFTEIKAGESFDLRVDGLTIADETGTDSINGTVSVQASPGELKAPENEKMFFELTEAQLLNLVMEIQQKGTAWQEKFMPEQSETEDALYGKDYAYGEHETGEEEETDYGTNSALPGDGYRADEGNGNQSEQDGEQNAEQPGYNGEQGGAYPENPNGDHPEAAPSGDTAVA